MKHLVATLLFSVLCSTCGATTSNPDIHQGTYTCAQTRQPHNSQHNTPLPTSFAWTGPVIKAEGELPPLRFDVVYHDQKDDHYEVILHLDELDIPAGTYYLIEIDPEREALLATEIELFPGLTVPTAHYPHGGRLRRTAPGQFVIYALVDEHGVLQAQTPLIVPNPIEVVSDCGYTAQVLVPSQSMGVLVQVVGFEPGEQLIVASNFSSPMVFAQDVAGANGEIMLSFCPVGLQEDNARWEVAIEGERGVIELSYLWVRD